MSEPVQTPSAPPPGGPPRWIFFAIFTISGFSGLIYESIWSHYLKLFLGHAAYAQSLVLMIFMGGLALGSWLTARFSNGLRAPILWYAAIEGIIGAIALVFHSLFVSVTDAFYFSILPGIDSPTLGGLLKWTAAALLILPQSVLLGMTFPLMSGGIIRRYPTEPGGSLAMLYFTNSIGAAVGVLASGFWLIGLVGLPGTILTAGLLNIALALTVWALVKYDPHAQDSRAPVAARAAASEADPLAVLFFVAAGITGAASFIYEIGWIRMLSLVLGATTHSFELMLSAFITGLAFGGLWIKRRIDRIEDPVRFAGWVQVLMGIMAVLTLPLYVRTFDWMAAMLTAIQRTDTGYTLFTAVSHGIALIVMVPTTFLAGMTLPLFTHALMRAKQGEGAIGRVYAANTLGSIAGVLFAVHIGMPLLGLKTLIVFGAALDIALGVTLLHRAAIKSAFAPALRGALVGGAALATVVALVDLDPRRLASGVYRYSQAELDEGTQVFFHKDGKTASITLSVAGSRVTISTNGKPDASIEMNPNAPPTSDEVTMIMAGALPFAYKPDAKIVANIGFGSGLTTHTMLASKNVERVDTIEIETAMVRAARGFGDRVDRAFSDPRSQIHIEDAKTFFSLQNERYDVIVAEPSNPWVSGVASLFSEEFYRTVPTYLAPGGLFVQWLQLYEFNDRLVHSVLKALALHFEDFAIYNTDSANILIVASHDQPLPQPSFDVVLQGTLGAELAATGLRSADDFLVRRTGSKPLLDAVLASSPVPVNSDYFPFLDLNAGRARFRNQLAGMFYGWSISSLPVLEMVGLGEFDAKHVTASVEFDRTLLVERAREVYDTFTGGGDESPSLGPALAVLRLLGQDCAAHSADNHWVLGLHTLATTALPFLNASEAAELLDAALPARCRPFVAERVRAWHALYGAVARRDAAAMPTAATAALRDRSADRAQRQYALAAEMLGHALGASPERTIDAWENRPEELRGLLPSAETELLLQIAQRRLSGDAPLWTADAWTTR